MKVIGIIAEYNPFHNGHAYQIAEIRRLTGADYIIVAMSGDFMQRGTPAIIDKYTRSQMALSCGVDLVIELPTLWSTASAEDFAMAGVTIFEKMGCVDGICFGAETKNLSLLSSLADILVDEPTDYRESLSSYIKEGLTFPAARARALVHYLTVSGSIGSLCVTEKTPSAEAISSIINEPNNILAIEYLKALKRRHSSITPYLIKRTGAGYHDATICECIPSQTSLGLEDAPTASATAIRRLLLAQNLSASSVCIGKGCNALYHSVENDKACLSDKAFLTLANTMPHAASELLFHYLQKSPALCAEDFSQILGYQLLNIKPESLAAISDCNEDIANRLYRNRQSFYSYEQFIEQNKSKDVTYTRISRILLHLLLHISQEKEAVGKTNDYIPYLRILGFHKSSTASSALASVNDCTKETNQSARGCAPLLTVLKQNASVPVISKLADAKKNLPAQAFSMLEDDIFAADLYEQIKFQKQQQNPLTYRESAAAQNEYTRGLVLL